MLGLQGGSRYSVAQVNQPSCGLQSNIYLNQRPKLQFRVYLMQLTVWFMPLFSNVLPTCPPESPFELFIMAHYLLVCPQGTATMLELRFPLIYGRSSQPSPWAHFRAFFCISANP